MKSKQGQNWSAKIVSGATAVILASLPAISAVAGGLSKATTTATGIQSDLMIIVPVIAVITGICLFAAYAGGIIQKNTLIQWAVGVIGAGSVATMVAAWFS